MAEVLTLRDLSDPGTVRAQSVLEAGGLVAIQAAPFAVTPGELTLFDERRLKPGVKNLSIDPETGRLSGAAADTEDIAAALSAMIVRYGAFADTLLERLAPSYGPALQKKRASFRPGAIETRALSPRKDDKRLHIDAFPANPVQGRRILRVFTNADPSGAPRHWRIGQEGFEAAAERFLKAPDFRPGGAWRQRLGLTRGRRTAYDAGMLKLHDRAKSDDDWQRAAPAADLRLPAGSTWVVFTDAVMHAALSGRHAFEQTYLLPVAAMKQEAGAPLRVLEKIAGRALV